MHSWHCSRHVYCVLMAVNSELKSLGISLIDSHRPASVILVCYAAWDGPSWRWSCSSCQVCSATASASLGLVANCYWKSCYCRCSNQTLMFLLIVVSVKGSVQGVTISVGNNLTLLLKQIFIIRGGRIKIDFAILRC